MIGRKITDQTITCKVIKPIPLSSSNNKNPSFITQRSTQNQQYNNLQTQKQSFHSQSNPNQPNINEGRIFGFSNQNIEVQLEFGLQNQNYFNKIGNYQNEEYKNTIKQDRQSGSRNVTHYFISNKDKPMNIESKKTISSMKNISQLVQTKNDKLPTTHTQNQSIKSIKQPKDHTKSINNKNVLNNKSQFISEKHINQPISDKNISQLSTDKNLNKMRENKILGNKNLNKQKDKSLNRHNIKSSTSPNISRHNQQKTQQDQKQKLSVNHVVDNKKIEIKKQKKQRQSIGQKKQANNKLSLHKSRQKIMKEQRGQVKLIQCKQQQQQMSFRAWEESYQQASVNIQNFSNNNNDQSSDKKNQLLVSQQEEIMRQNKNEIEKNSKGFEKKPINKQHQHDKVVLVKKSSVKKYMSVKQQIQLQLKQKRQRNKKLQLQKRDRMNELYIKRETVRVQSEQQYNERQQLQNDQGEQQQERSAIPQPILLKVDNFVQSVLQQTNEFSQKMIDVKTEKVAKICTIDIGDSQDEQQQGNEFLMQYNNGIVVESVITQKELIIKNAASYQAMKYNYVQSSSQQQNQQQQQQDRLNNIINYNNEAIVRTQQQQNNHNHNQQPYEDQHYQDYYNKNKNFIDQQYQTTNQQCIDSEQQINLSQQCINLSEKQINTNNINSKVPQNKNITSKQTKQQIKSQSYQQQSQQQQDSSQQQEQQENNPKLIEYLKQRNLISTKKQNHQINTNTNNQRINTNNQRTIRTNAIKQTTTNTNKDNLTRERHNQGGRNKQQQLVNNYLRLKGQTPQVIVQLDEQYLQSSIVCNNNNNNNKINQSQQYGNNITPYKDYINSSYENSNSNNHYELSQQKQYQQLNHIGRQQKQTYQQPTQLIYDNRLSQSSDSQHNHPLNINHIPPFISNTQNNTSSSSNNNHQLDEIFSLGLDSLLNKQFINLNH